MRHRHFLATLLSLTTLLASCSGDDTASDDDSSPKSADSTTTSALPAVEWETAPPAPEGLRLSIDENDRVRVHTLVAPAELTANSAHAIETADHVVVVDAGNSRDTAEAFRGYVDALGKPIERVILSHGHPDHWFGVSLAFPHDLIWADAETIDRIAERGEGDIERLGQFFTPDQIPSEPVEISNVLEPGTLDIDGVELKIDVYEAAEAPSQVTVTIAEAKVLVAQDLVYSDGHLFTGNGSFQEWIDVLDTLASTTDDSWTVLAGHGMPTDESIFEAEADYLRQAEEANMSATSAAEYIEEMNRRYPDMGDALILQFAANQLYSEGGFATSSTTTSTP